MKAAGKKRARQCGSKDTSASLKLPDKKQHFDNSQLHIEKIPSKKGTSKPGKKSEDLTIDNGGRHEIEVRYQDGMWYRGWLSSVNVITGKWIVRFCDNDETTEANFPDKDVNQN